MSLQIPCTSAICHSFSTSHAVAAINTLQQWYNESTGLWESTGWWNSANAVTALADFAAVEPSLNNVINHVLGNTFSKAQEANVKVLKIMGPKTVDSYTWLEDRNHYSKPSIQGFPGFINEYYDDEGWWV